ncbi:MAG TPA: hypothetical protein VJQ82_17950 [Terriglobales bacterium]|nr:hypothetical protein [Terriglobales bacterium]
MNWIKSWFRKRYMTEDVENENYALSVIHRWGHEFYRGPIENEYFLQTDNLTSVRAKQKPYRCERCDVTLLNVTGPCPGRKVA